MLFGFSTIKVGAAALFPISEKVKRQSVPLTSIRILDFQSLRIFQKTLNFYKTLLKTHFSTFVLIGYHYDDEVPKLNKWFLNRGRIVWRWWLKIACEYLTEYYNARNEYFIILCLFIVTTYQWNTNISPTVLFYWTQMKTNDNYPPGGGGWRGMIHLERVSPPTPLAPSVGHFRP